MKTPVGYARYQLRDSVALRLSLPIVLVAVLTALPVYIMTKHSPAGFIQTAQGISFAKQMYAQSVTLFLPLGAFLCAVGVMSTDRQHGYYRFLFSKPVSVPVYYAQAYVVAGAAFIAIFGLITWGFGAMTVHFSVHRAMEAALLTYVLLGGVGFLLGALTRFDAIAFILVYLAALLLQQLAAAPNGLRNGGLPAWLAVVGEALPPVVKLDGLRNHLYAAQPLDAAQLWPVLAYGAGAAVLGLAILRWRPLAQ
jgi:ABC-type transport system involved in multi-copper enzyme maturation permease subunit